MDIFGVLNQNLNLKQIKIMGDKLNKIRIEFIKEFRLSNKEEILKQNVKKGGKYIVFIPVTDQGDIEDEEGNRIGLKTGEDKIKAYQDYLNEIFKEK